MSIVIVLGVYPREMKTYKTYPYKTYVGMLIAALFIIANPQKLSKCLSPCEQIKYSIAIKWNFIWQQSDEVLTHATTWVNLEKFTEAFSYKTAQIV